MGRRLIFILPAAAYLLLLVFAVAGQQPRGGVTVPPDTSKTDTTTPPAPEKTEPGGKPGGEGAAGAGAGAAGAGRYDNLREGMKVIAEGSRAISGWALLIIGASIVAIVGTSYMRPLNLRVRLTYLLFIPGWVLIGLSSYYGDWVSRRYMAAAVALQEDRLRSILVKVNTEFAAQLFYFQSGLLVFSVWLILFLLWWVFGSGETTNK